MVPHTGRRRQALTGLTLAALIIGGWLALHIYGVFIFRFTPFSVGFTLVIVAVQSWLGAGMFIVAHDAMHGSLAPGRPRVNAAIGQLALGLYAGFPYDAMAAKHHAHHRHPGTEHDPDFHAAGPRTFTPWFAGFIRDYFRIRELAVVTAVLAVYLLGFHVRPLNAAVFWGLPAIGSALQLFVFGTWLPHRHKDGGVEAFADRHRARSLDYSWLASLLTCFHFGYHLEHHHSPQTPWWALPKVRALGRSR